MTRGPRERQASESVPPFFNRLSHILTPVENLTQATTINCYTTFERRPYGLLAIITPPYSPVVMSVTNPAASRLLCRSLAVRPAKASSHAAVASRAASRASTCHHQRQQQSHFHTSTSLAGRKRSPFPNVKYNPTLLDDPADKEGTLDGKTLMRKYEKKISPEYDDTDIESLKRNYTPEQLEAILLGEKFTPSQDLVVQGRVRTDPYRFRHLEDFSTIQPVVDKRPKSGRPVDPKARFMTPDEFGDDLLEHYREASGEQEKPFGVDVDQAYTMYEDMRSRMLNKEEGQELTEDELLKSVDKVLGPVSAQSLDVDKALRDIHLDKGPKKKVAELSEEEKAAARDEDLEFYKYMMERNSMTGFDGGDTALAPDLPDKVPGVAGLYKQQMSQEEEDLDPEGRYQDLRRQTGMSIKQIIDMYQRNTKILVSRYVSNQTRLGKIRSTSVLVVAGNNDGWLGMGEAKSVDGVIAEAKAKLLAIRNMRPIRRFENRTIYGNVVGKSGATVVELYTRPPGTDTLFLCQIRHHAFKFAAIGC